MGIALPQLAPASEDRVSGAQVIDGSLEFSGTDQKLERTPGSQGNLQTWSLSAWIKLLKSNQEHSIFSAHTGSSDRLHFRVSSGQIQFAQNTGSWDFDIRSNALLRDNGWYHIMAVMDLSNSTQNDRAILYVNGERQSLGTNTLPSNTTTNSIVNAVKAHYIGEARSSTDYYGRMSTFYLIDGQALGPESFGFTDPLTNTWRPKKYEGTFGTNGVYLPMDGNSPIGDDKSGQGNNWTPVNFGGSNSLDKATGAKPILNTLPGGTIATPGVFGSRENVGYAVTVYDDGGGNKYYIDGTKQATLNGLIRGATYTFDTSDSTLGSTHPFRLSATSAHGTEYTDGVVAITGAATTITVPHNAPNSLYYYCTAHSGMGSNITGITTNEKLADQYASNCVLALPLVGTSSDVSVSVACTSTTKAVTTNGDPTASTTQSNFYRGSFYFDGTDDRFTTDIGSGGLPDDFCIEYWIYADNISGDRGHFHMSSTSGGLVQSTTSLMVSWGNSEGDTNMYVGNGAVTDIDDPNQNDVWKHYAVVRSSGTLKLYVNGKVAYSASNTVDMTGFRYLSISGYYNTNFLWKGYIQDFRIYTGGAKYTSNFIPASTNPDILPDTPSGVSGGSKLAKVTEGAVSFDGSGDYLSLADNADFNLAGNDFTIEAFVYHNSTDYGANGGYDAIMAQWVDSSGSDRMFAWETVGSGDSADLEFYYYTDDGTFHGPVQGAALGKNRWYHVAIVRNGNSMVVYIDGVGGAVTTETDNLKNSTNNMTIGGNVAGAAGYWPGFISNLRFINGTALYTANFTPPSATPLTNVTNTKLLCCQSNTSAIAAAVSPGTITANGNAAANNFNPFNTDINIVRGQETGYCTWNPLVVTSNNSLSNGNLTASHTASTGWTGGVWSANSATIVANTGVSSGSWYWEVHIDSESSPGYTAVGITTRPVGGPYYVGYADNGIAYTSTYIYQDSAYGSGAGSLPTTASGDTIGVALDMDNGHIWFSKNGSYVYGNPYTRTGSQSSNIIGTMYPAVSQTGSNTGFTAAANFGQKPFKFPPPDGFQPLNAANVRPVKVITRPDQYVGVSTWTGNNGIQSINAGLKPDFVWIKGRSNARDHVLFDTIRGPLKTLTTNGTAAEATQADTLTAFNSDGFTIGSQSRTGINNETYVGWSWKAGGSKNTFNVDDVGYASAAAAGLDAGTVNPNKVSVGTKNGFSIIELTTPSSGTTYSFAHGLGAKPSFLIARQYETTGSYYVWHQSLSANNSYVLLNANTVENSGATVWASTDMTSTVISDTASGHWGTSQKMLYYAWTDIPGLQKFGSYSGNGTADNGPFVELGFRPAVILIKRTTSGSGGFNWTINDSERGKYNPNGTAVFPNLSNQESTNDEYEIDFLSNGFKPRCSTPDSINVSGQTYIYAAWAEAPTFNLYGAQSNAR